MCFSPYVSAATAVVELCLALVLYSWRRRSPFAGYFALFITILGAYQLSETLVCFGFDPIFWARTGFLLYTVLPALGFHGVVRYAKSGAEVGPAYALAAIFAIIASGKDLLWQVSCGSWFVRVDSLFFGPSRDQIISWAYWLYYFGFILASVVVLSRVRKEGGQRERVAWWGMVGLAAMFLPTIFLVLISPIFEGMFPSVLCQFALLLALCLTYAAALDKRP